MIIYRITNKVNGKVYIGKTKKTLKQRMYSHKCCAKHGSSMLIAKAINKYGESAFTYEVIDGANSESELSYREVLHIHLSSSLYPNGYNLRLDSKPHAITNKKQSEIMKSKSENYKQLEEMTKKAAFITGTKVKCIELGTGHFTIANSFNEAAKLGNISPTYLQNMLKGVKPYKPVNGYLFEFVNKETIKRKSKYKR